MRSTTALRIYVSLFLATTARGDVNWNETHDQALRAFRDNQFEIAESLFRKSAELARQPDEQATTANDLGVLLHYSLRNREAKTALTQALTLWQKLGRKDAAARSAHSLGTVLRALGEYQESERIMRQALATQPGRPIDSALLTIALADLLREEGHVEEARNFAQVTLQMPGLSWRPIVDATVIIADIDREARHYQASLDGWTKVLSESRAHNDATIEAVALRGLGETALMMGDRAAAEPSLRKSLAYFETVQNKHQTAATLNCLAELYIAEGKPAMADEALRRAVDLDEAVIGPTHPQIAVMLQLRADAAIRLGAFPRAKADMERAWSILRVRFGDESPVAGAFLANRGMLLERSGNNADAAADYERAAGILRNGGQETLQLRTILMEHYAVVLRALHRKDQAKAALAEAKSFRHQ